MEKYQKWKDFDVDEALTALENEDKPDEPNLRLEKTTDASGKGSVHINCEDYKKSKDEVVLDQDIAAGVGNLRTSVLEGAGVAGKLKEEGNRFFRARKYKEAREKYGLAIRRMKVADMAIPIMSGRLSHRIKSTLVVLHNNFAMASIKLGDHSAAVEYTTKILDKWDPVNEKALYRRGRAHLALSGMKSAAIKDFEKVIELNPKNLAAKKALQDAMR